ncbi:hypothetical protein D1816_02925 [Aquimarina sp. AD10]|uniref:hypothetical protein n=1 Tax=Aquimarina TaxID=290174 RepID=UPI000E52580C|nr:MULTISPECIES: hypothetical protein [Aquimarina]AXT59343.1 hypothetical protein D1816_02925 [Aquimarina sp. AD10]RKM91905.1 hypothetical protein D7033_21620 [Aquimarina sp. AD10]
MKNKKKLYLKKMNIAQLDSIKAGNLGPLPLPTVTTINSICDHLTTTNTNQGCIYPESLDICVINKIK